MTHMNLLITIWISLITLLVAGQLFWVTFQQRGNLPILQRTHKIKLVISGFIANVADTIGVGSFAVLVALDKHWQLVDDQELPGTLNAQSPLPAMAQALFFLQAVHVDITTLVALIVSASLGGFLGGYVVANLDKHRVRRLMLAGYLSIAVMILASKLGLLPVGGDLMALHGTWLIAAMLGMFISGVLPAIGVGSYAPIQVILFLLGMSPLAAYPIMTASAAIQQSVAAYAFIQRRQVALKASCIIGLAGIVGVFIAAPLVTYINPNELRWLLLAVVLYNVFMLKKSIDAQELSTQRA